MIHQIIDIINSSLTDLIAGGQWQGIATTERDQPVIAEKPAGIDDKYPVRAYHKLGTLTSRPVDGMGRTSDQQNTYSNSMVVFLNRTRCKTYPDELLLAIQANIPEVIKMQPYSSVTITINRTDLDSGTVYAQEYPGAKELRLKKDQYLFRITYTVETTFKKGCFKTCPQN